MSLETYVIQTTLGKARVDSDRNVFAHLNGHLFIKKDIADLNIGELVLYSKEHIDTTLEDVEPHLERSSRYADALNNLHQRNDEGIYVPNLRVSLIRGLSENGDCDLADTFFSRGDLFWCKYRIIVRLVAVYSLYLKNKPP